MTRFDPQPVITDAEVAALPLAEARADLLEDIMATPATDLTPTRSRRPAPGWLMAAAAAAAVAAIAVAPTLGADPGGPGSPSGGPDPQAPRQQVVEAPQVAAAPVAPVVPEVQGGRYVGVEVAGWDVEALYEDAYGLTIGWEDGDRWLEVVRYPADQHASYFADRDRSMAGSATQLFGRAATTWAYSADDHATMTVPADGFFFEIRAAGLGLPAYEDLLASLVQTDEAGFYEGLPEGTVTPANRDQAVAGLLEGVATPEGFGADDVELSGFNDPYQSAAAVAGAVGCAWLDVYADGTDQDRQRALAALDASPGWPLFAAMTEGGYPEFFFAIADRLRGGDDPASLRGGLC